MLSRLINRTTVQGQNVILCSWTTTKSPIRKKQNVWSAQVRQFSSEEKLDPKEFYQSLRNAEFDFFCGVPDSLLIDFTSVVEQANCTHLVTANEGCAISLGAGYHLATGKIPFIYFQNSGLGNAINPLVSLADPNVYNIPMLLFIGWRGEPNKKDEPQHQIQGQITAGTLSTIGTPFRVLSKQRDEALESLKAADTYFKTTRGPFALLVRRDTFSPNPSNRARTSNYNYELTREDAVKMIVNLLDEKDVIVGTTGMLSRELFEYRETKNQGHEKDFLTVGSMGHASAIALGISIAKRNRQIFCLDGDGAAIMHMGNIASIGQIEPPNFKHIIINNGCHDSVGGMFTAAADVKKFSFPGIALACGYKNVYSAASATELESGIEKLQSSVGPALLEVKVRSGGRSNLGRPTRTPQQNKSDFMKFLKGN